MEILLVRELEVAELPTAVRLNTSFALHQVLSGSGRCCPLAVARQSVGESVAAQPYIEGVFDNDLVELDAAGTLAAAEANEHTLITAEVRRLQIAAHWADLHPGEAVAESRLPGTEHPIRLGGEGTPTVGDFAAAELGCVLRMSDGSAARLIGHALDLRHVRREALTTRMEVRDLCRRAVAAGR